MIKTQTLEVIIRHSRNAAELLVDGVIARVTELHEFRLNRRTQAKPDSAQFHKDCDTVIEHVVEEISGRIFGALGGNPE